MKYRIGFDQEHKRTDRDQYVNVDLDKMSPDWVCIIYFPINNYDKNLLYF